MDIVIARCNPVVYDPRVFKIAGSLKKKYSLLTVGWNRENVPKKIIEGYISDLKLCDLRSPYGKSMTQSPKMVIYYTCFWLWLFIQLTKYRPSIVHACDLDTVIPCYLYKVLFRKKLVFDVFDRYAMAFVSKESKFFFSLINSLEEFFSNHVDVLITISEKVLATFEKRKKDSVIIMNCCEDRAVNKKNSNDKLRLVYTGDIVSKTRGLESLKGALLDLTDVELVMAGWYMANDKEFLNEILQLPNVKFNGTLEPSDALNLEASSDVIIGLYDPDRTWHHLTLPNKHFETMMCGVPLITNVAPELVQTIDFGIIVEYNNVKQLKEAIVRLKNDPELRIRLGANGRKAFLEKYNWGKMEEKLYEIYNNLMKR